jgi:predicted DNA-binding transcriptional regulator YafY
MVEIENRMEATLGTLEVLKLLSEGSVSRQELVERLEERGIGRDERTVRRYVTALREAGFGVRNRSGCYELVSSPVRLDFTDQEALAALTVMESLAEREPVYGEHLASAARKLRGALPSRAVKFADSGRVEFEVSSASDPPEDPGVMERLRRAVHREQRLEIFYYSLRSGNLRWRTVEPRRVSYVQRAHRLYAYEREENRVNEFRVNRIKEAKMLPEKFSHEAHARSLEPVKVRLSERAFTAYGKSIIPYVEAVEPLENGGAIVKGSTDSVFWTIREISALGPEAELLASPYLRSELLQFLNSTLEKYS